MAPLMASPRASNDERQNESQDIKQVNPVFLRPGGEVITNCFSHHALTLAIDGKLYLSPLERDKLKVSCHLSFLDESVN